MKRPDRLSRESCDQSLMSAHRLCQAYVTVKPVRSGLAESLSGLDEFLEYEDEKEL